MAAWWQATVSLWLPEALSSILWTLKTSQLSISAASPLKTLAKFERGRELQGSRLTIFLVARGRGFFEKHFPSWEQDRNAFLLAWFGAASWSEKVLLGPGWALAHAMLPPFFQGYRGDVGKPVLLWCDREYTSVDIHVTNVLREHLILIQFLIKVLGREELVMKAWKWYLLLRT